MIPFSYNSKAQAKLKNILGRIKFGWELQPWNLEEKNATTDNKEIMTMKHLQMQAIYPITIMLRTQLRSSYILPFLR